MGLYGLAILSTGDSHSLHTLKVLHARFNQLLSRRAPKHRPPYSQDVSVKSEEAATQGTLDTKSWMTKSDTILCIDSQDFPPIPMIFEPWSTSSRSLSISDSVVIRSVLRTGTSLRIHSPDCLGKRKVLSFDFGELDISLFGSVGFLGDTSKTHAQARLDQLWFLN